MTNPFHFTYLIGLLGAFGVIAWFWYLDTRDLHTPDDPTKSRPARAVRAGLRIGLAIVVIVLVWVLEAQLLWELMD